MDKYKANKILTDSYLLEISSL